MVGIVEASAKGIVLDGAARVIPSNANGDLRLSDFPFVLSTDAITIASTVITTQMPMVPFNATIKAIVVSAQESTATDTQVLNVGTNDDTDKFGSNLDISDMAAGEVKTFTTLATTATGFIKRDISAGQLLAVDTGVHASNVAKIGVSLVIVPRLS